MSKPSKVKHGTYSSYVLGCRCEPCTLSSKLYQRERKARSNSISPIADKLARRDAKRKANPQS